MKKIYYSCGLLIALSLSACGGKEKNVAEDSVPVQQPVVQDTVVPVEKETALDYKLMRDSIMPQNDRPMIVDFSADWCPPCRQLEPIFKELKAEYEGEVDFVSINVDDNVTVAAAYEVESIPLLVYLSPEGKVLNKTVGFVKGEAIKANIKKYFNVVLDKKKKEEKES